MQYLSSFTKSPYQVFFLCACYACCVPVTAPRVKLLSARDLLLLFTSTGTTGTRQIAPYRRGPIHLGLKVYRYASIGTLCFMCLLCLLLENYI